MFQLIIALFQRQIKGIKFPYQQNETSDSDVNIPIEKQVVESEDAHY